MESHGIPEVNKELGLYHRRDQNVKTNAPRMNGAHLFGKMMMD
jgi:hypothetical protein